MRCVEDIQHGYLLLLTIKAISRKNTKVKPLFLFASPRFPLFPVFAGIHPSKMKDSL
jgi:hypothetical protein